MQIDVHSIATRKVGFPSRTEAIAAGLFWGLFAAIGFATEIAKLVS